MIAGFEGEASRVTDLLGISPSLARNAGEITRAGRPAREALWLYTVEEPELRSGRAHDQALRVLLEVIANRTEQLTEVRRALNPETMTITGSFYYAPDEQAGIWLDPDQMQVLVTAGVGWGVDILSAQLAQK